MVHIDMQVADIQPELAREALAGRVPQLSPSAVLALLAQDELPGLDPARTLLEAATDPQLEPLVRAGAVKAYGRTGAPEVTSRLTELVDSDTERVATAAASALGQFGTPAELPSLRGLRERLTSNSAREQVAFAEALIVHRFGVTDHPVDLAQVETLDEPQLVGGVTFRSDKPGVLRRRLALASMVREFPTLNPTQQDVYEIQCGPRLMMVAVAKDVVDSAGEGLAERPALPAIVANQDPEHGDYHVAYVVLSQGSARGGLSLRISRLGGGQTLYVGEGTVHGEGLDVELKATRVAGAVPVAGRIRLSRRGVEIAGTSGTQAVPALEPESAG